MRRGLLSEPTIEVFVEGRRVGLLSFEERPQPPADDARYFAVLEEFAEDLLQLQRHSSQEFPVPDEFSRLDRITLRAVRLLLDGKCVIMPQAQRLTATLSGADDEYLRTVLSGQPTTLLMTQEAMGIELFGREFRLGQVSMFSTRVVCANATDAQAALNAGTAAGLEVALEPQDGRHWRFYKPDLWHDKDAPLSVTPWSLTGIEEAPDVADESMSLSPGHMPGPSPGSHSL